jgi:hypothetical protein
MHWTFPSAPLTEKQKIMPISKKKKIRNLTYVSVFKKKLLKSYTLKHEQLFSKYLSR